MSFANDTNEPVAEKDAGTTLWSRRFADNACLQVNSAVTKAFTVFVQLRHKSRLYAWRLLADERHKPRPIIVSESITHS